MKRWLILLTVLFFFIYYPIWIWMVDRWMAPTSYYSHGFLIPLMSSYLVWRDRKLLKFDPEQGHFLGLLVALFGFFCFLLSAFWQIYFAGAVSSMFVFLGALIYLYGFPPLRYLWFPFVFLVFMIPIPLITVADISLKLKLFAAAVAIRVIDFLGIVAVREGSYIHFKNGTMIVGDICSGLRSLIALLAFGAYFAYLTKLSRFKKVFLFLMSMPVAWVANIFRIVTLCVLAHFFGIEAVSGFVHDASGILIFIVAFILLFTLEKILQLPLLGKNKHAQD